MVVLTFARPEAALVGGPLKGTTEALGENATHFVQIVEIDVLKTVVTSEVTIGVAILLLPMKARVTGQEVTVVWILCFALAYE